MIVPTLIMAHSDNRFYDEKICLISISILGVFLNIPKNVLDIVYHFGVYILHA